MIFDVMKAQPAAATEAVLSAAPSVERGEDGPCFPLFGKGDTNRLVVRQQASYVRLTTTANPRIWLIDDVVTLAESELLRRPKGRRTDSLMEDLRQRLDLLVSRFCGDAVCLQRSNDVDDVTLILWPAAALHWVQFAALDIRCTLRQGSGLLVQHFQEGLHAAHAAELRSWSAVNDGMHIVLHWKILACQ